MQGYEIAIISFTVLCLYWFLAKPLVDFTIWRNWWSSNPPTNDCLDILSVAYYKSNRVTYWLYNLSWPGNKRFKSDQQTEFIMYLIISYAYGISTNGILTPRAMCDTIVPDKPRWNQQPWPQSRDEWRLLVQQWAGYDSTTRKASGADWTDQDNFLLHTWNIPYDAPLITDFIDNIGDPGHFPSAILALFGFGDDGNGFFGLTNTVETPDTAEGTYYGLLWGRNKAPDGWNTNGNVDPDVKTCSTTTAAGSVLQNITTGVFMGAMIGGPLGIIAGIGTALVGSLIALGGQGCL